MAAAISQAIAKHLAPAHLPEAARGSFQEIETVAVPAIGSSLAKSLQAKRESQAVIDVLTTDKDVAEALQRVSGVSISREFAKGERDGKPVVS